MNLGLNSRSALYLLIACGVVAAVAVLLVSASGADDANDPQARGSISELGGSISLMELRDRFSILESKDREVVDLPSALSRAWRDSVSSAEGETVALGRISGTGGHRIYVAGNEHGVCLLDEGESGSSVSTCTTPESAVRGELVAVSVCEPGLSDGRLRVTGLAPDGVDRAVMVSTSRSRAEGSREFSVSSNVYEALVKPADARLFFVRGDVESLVTELPLAALALGPNESCEPIPAP